jgi:hypothetical protein
MSKDPAFLFYSGDFLIGTTMFTDDQTGKYIKLLCYQHQTGHLSKSFIIKLCGIWDDLIMSKFSIDENGAYFNERLENEIKKRSDYTESRRKNLASSKKKPRTPYVGGDIVIDTNITALKNLVASNLPYWNNIKQMLNITQGQFDQLLGAWAKRSALDNFTDDEHRRNSFRKFLEIQVSNSKKDKKQIEEKRVIKDL